MNGGLHLNSTLLISIFHQTIGEVATTIPRQTAASRCRFSDSRNGITVLGAG
jgi:hypothetical protein